MPWLADVARIERAWMDAYHAADRSVLPMQALTDIPATQLGDLYFTPHPASRIVRSAYPAVAIFAMNRRSDPPEPLCANEPENALITRPDQEVIVSTLPAGAATFLSSLIEGESLGIAAAAAFDAAPSFDLPANLSGMISSGVFTALHIGA